MMDTEPRTQWLNKQNVKDIYALSPMQEGMLFHALMEEDSAFYYQQVTYRMGGRLDVGAVEAALNDLVARHDSLRTVFKYRNVELPLQIVLKEWRADFAYEDLRHLPDDAQREAHLRRRKEEDRARGFDLGKDALMRVRLFQLGDEEFDFTWSHHHIIMDGWCAGLLAVEFLELYNSHVERRPHRLPPARPYGTYIQWLAERDKDDARRYWRSYLAGYDETARFPVQKSPAQQEKGHRTERLLLTLDAEKTDALRRLAARQQVTLYQLIQPLWGVLLAAYTGRRDIIFGSVVSGRPPEIEGVEGIVGLFINAIPVRLRLAAEDTFTDILRRAKAASLESESRSFFPLNEIQELSENRSNLFDHILVFQNLPAWEEQQAGADKADIRILNADFFERTSYDFWLDIVPGERLTFKLNYNANVHERAFIERTARVLETIVGQVLARPDIPLKQIALLAPEDRALLDAFNATDREFPKDRLAFQVVEQLAAARGDAPALVCNGRVTSYAEMNAYANRLARHLTATARLGADDRVAILMPRSEVMLESILAVWKAGAAYVPVDVNYPPARILTMIEDSGAKAVITDSRAVAPGLLSQLAEATRVVALDEAAAALAAYDSGNPQSPARADSLAYVIYTSGSTGKPKGAMVEHAGMLNHLYAKIEDLQLNTGSVVAQNASHCFDISVWQFFAALMVGGRTVVYDNDLVLSPQRLLQSISSDGVNVLELVPSYLSMLLALVEQETLPRLFKNLRYLLVTGEVLKPSLLKRWFELLPDVPVVNAYGPTEAADDITHYIMREAPDRETVPIGRALPNLKIYVADEHLNLCPVGVKGEILVSGIGVGRGYLNDPAATARAFTEDPFRPEGGVRLYRTGDVGRYTEEGLLEFFGRKDNQVKVRGSRLELEEIESTIALHPGVAEAAVIDRQNDGGETYLSGYLVADGDFQMDALRAFLAERLPDYMIPSYFTVLDALPLTVNGKLDRKALREMPVEEEHEHAEAGYLAPRDEMEERLARLWQEVLQVEQVGVRDNFFDLGGDSFKAIRLVSKFGAGFLVPDLYRHQTVEALAAFVRENARGSVSFLYELTPKQTRKKYAVVAVPNSAGDPVIYQPTTDALTKLTDEYAFYGINLPRLEPGPGEGMFDALQSLVGNIIEEVRRKIDVPIILYGQCNGAALALQLALRMEEEQIPYKALCIGAQLPRRRIMPEKDARTEKDILRLLETLEATYPTSPEDQLIFMRNFRYDGLLARASYNDCMQRIKARAFRKLRAPLYCIVGDKDPLTKNYARRHREWLNYADQVTLVEMSGVGHFMWRDKPAELAEILYQIGEGRPAWESAAKPSGLLSRVAALFSAR